MRFSTHAQSIGDLKAHVADILDRLATDGEPVPVTQNGEARAVLREVHTCEETSAKPAADRGKGSFLPNGICKPSGRKRLPCRH